MRTALVSLLLGLFSLTCHAPAVKLSAPVIGAEVLELPAWYQSTIDVVCDRLGERAPLSRSVRVYVADLPMLWGQASYSPGDDSYEIILSSRCQQRSFLVGVIMHEWAHLLVFDSSPSLREGGQHGILWGIAYSRVYRIVIENDLQPADPEGR